MRGTALLLLPQKKVFSMHGGSAYLKHQSGNTAQGKALLGYLCHSQCSLIKL